MTYNHGRVFLSFLFTKSSSDTAQEIKFFVKDFSVNVTKSAGKSGFGHIY